MDNNVNHYHLHLSFTMIEHNPIHNELFQLYSLILDSGGPVMLILIGMSVIGTCVFVLKAIQFYFGRVSRYRAVHDALKNYHAGRWAEAAKLLQQERNPAAAVLLMVMRGKSQGSPEALLREEAERLTVGAINNLRSHLRILEVIATLAPLLGLLGTVLGIIDAFHQMELAGSKVDVSMLSGGIWVALLTTAAGLSVGIPAVVAVNWIESRVERFSQQTEDLTTRLFTLPIATEDTQEEIPCESPQQLAGQGA
jgi:biopolymer transport protein ExbB